MSVRGALAVLLLVTLGCGAAQPTPSPAATGAQAATAPPTAAATAAATAAPTRAAAPSFVDLVKGAHASVYKVTYRLSGNVGGQTYTGEQTWYSKPPKFRYDFVSTTAGASGRVSVIDIESGTYFCIAAEGQNLCLKQPREQALGQNPGARFEASVGQQPDQYDPSYEGTRSISGQTAQCFAVKPRVSGDFIEARVCYAQGVPLLIQSKGQGFDSSMEATSFSTSVTDADFTLPAPVQALPAIPGYPP